MLTATELKEIRLQFPILQRCGPNNEKLIYLDSAATALKPQTVINTMGTMLSSHTANIHRSVHFLSDETTEMFEGAREIAATFLNAQTNEIVFTRNTTEALNLIAYSKYAKGRVITSIAEHHSNFLAWNNIVHRMAIDAEGAINLNDLEQELIKGDVSLVSLSHISNVTGYVTDINKVTALCRRYGAKVVLDCAQSAPHMPLDVVDLDCDFLAFSGHKLGAPAGVGVLFGKAELLEDMDFFLRGGSTIEDVQVDKQVPKNAPWKFEAGTPAIECVVGLGAALKFLMEIGMDAINDHHTELCRYTADAIQRNISYGRVLGPMKNRASGPISISLRGHSPHTLARGLSDRYSICLRSGYHCAQPLHKSFDSPPSLRISFWIYNFPEEIDAAINGLNQLVKLTQR